jgi:peptidase YpeB-like protein
VFAKRKIIIGSLVAVAVIALGAGVGLAAGGEDGNPLTGGTYDRAAAAALAEVGEGTVTEAEREEGGGYEVEVQRDDGTEVEVQLDGNFHVTRSGSDDGGSEGGEEDD